MNFDPYGRISNLSLTDHLSLHEPHRALEFAYFPNEGLISLLIELNDGRTVEVGLLGNDGALGMTGVLGLKRSPLRAVVQIAGDGFRIRVDTLRELLPLNPELREILGRCAARMAMQVAQTSACNRLHKIEERLARWLLIAQDRMRSDTVRITHDFLATVLGSDRPSVSLAAGMLQRNGIIRCVRGSITILNRKKLEQFTCECYGVIREYNSEASWTEPFRSLRPPVRRSFAGNIPGRPRNIRR
jgi:CRP-like cAMP-binding protein